MKNKVLLPPFKIWLGRTFIYTVLLLKASTLVAFENTITLKRNPDSYLEEKIREELCKNLWSPSGCVYIPERNMIFFDTALQSIAFLKLTARELKSFKNVISPVERSQTRSIGRLTGFLQRKCN
ncbi:MAG: hypothetical protein HC830_14585 [Bacteroidetes bacterium]|nr:hypothetical protein [Bacteroidota bacterium]